MGISEGVVVSLTPMGRKKVEREFNGQTSPPWQVMNVLYEMSGEMDGEALATASGVNIQKLSSIVNRLESQKLVSVERI